jgi:murein DD-endopeptidase MepM/ murein hydrolase activator NlpD
MANDDLPEPSGYWRVIATRARLCQVLALTLAVVLLGAAPARAEPGNDKDRVDAELARTQATLEAATGEAQQALAAYAKANAELPAARDVLADARAKVAVAEAAARQADREAAAAATAQAEAMKGYEEAAAKVDQARAHVGEFASRAYRGSGFLEINSFLESGSPSEFATRVGYLDQVAAGQKRALDALTVARMDAKVRGDAAEAARQRADAARHAAQTALVDSRAAAGTAEKAANDVQNLIDKRQKALDVANQQRSAVLARYQELKAESDRIAAELRAAASRGTSSGGGGGSSGPARPPPGGGAFFLMPTAGWKSSDFGQRYDPYYHVTQLHAGVDIAAPSGQAIYAAADGRVVTAGWSGGYGNYTCISHGPYRGSDLATCYGHQSVIEVSVGQSVRRGQVIGRVGSTGASTGSHLHFEVRRGGDPVDPVPWLPGCFC